MAQTAFLLSPFNNPHLNTLLSLLGMWLYAVEMQCTLGDGYSVSPQMPFFQSVVVPGNKSGIILLVLGGKDTPGMFAPVL
jgi:hypothetical protein